MVTANYIVCGPSTQGPSFAIWEIQRNNDDQVAVVFQLDGNVVVDTESAPMRTAVFEIEWVQKDLAMGVTAAYPELMSCDIDVPDNFWKAVQDMLRHESWR
jgi:hypothetical protein